LLAVSLYPVPGRFAGGIHFRKADFVVWNNCPSSAQARDPCAESVAGAGCVSEGSSGSTSSFWVLPLPKTRRMLSRPLERAASISRSLCSSSRILVWSCCSCPGAPRCVECDVSVAPGSISSRPVASTFCRANAVDGPSETSGVVSTRFRPARCTRKNAFHLLILRACRCWSKSMRIRTLSLRRVGIATQ
jgi:hypothetical protein